MKKNGAVAVLAALLLMESAPCAKREVIRTDWTGFRQQVLARDLQEHPVHIRLSGGEVVKAHLLEIADTGLVVRPTRSAKRWKNREGKALIPKEQVGSVRFHGRTGHGGLIGGLVGLGAGGGVGAAIAANSDVSEGAGVILLPVAGVALAVGGAAAGYFIGRDTNRAAPEFILAP